jgi:hypothetical protein
MTTTRKPRSRERGAGSVNISAKESLHKVFHKLGGVDGMLDWAKLNKTDFYRLYARLVPTEIEGVVTGNVTVIFDDPTARPAGYERKPAA